MKDFEEKLGFRDYTPDESDEANRNLSFDTPKGKMSQTNFVWVYYVCTPESGSKFINSQVNFVKSAADFSDPKVKEWFTANGYGNNFTVNLERGFVAGYDATGKIMAALYINTDYNVAQVQIVENSNTQSISQLRRIATKHYKMMRTRLSKQSKLQRRLHR